MKYLFYKIKDKQFPKMGEWWVLVIDTPDRLVSYNDFRGKNLVHSYYKGKEKLKKKYHLGSEEWTMMKLLELRPKRKTVIDDINILSDELIAPMTHSFLDGKIPLINQVGGYRFLDKSVKILEQIEKNELIFPKDNRLGIKISRFPMGKHYYAKVGQYEVKDEDGNIKWNTAQEAERQAKKYKKKLENND